MPEKAPDDLRAQFSTNNFDLVRLVAASEVAVTHALAHLLPEQTPSAVSTALKFVPGVPVFFFLSGLLISRSWESSRSGTQYLRNRALRLLPALLVVNLFSVAILFATGYIAEHPGNLPMLGAWFVGQSTLLQFWTPDFLRSFGVGAVNGSLWTIAVEIQFYAVIPAIYLLGGRLSTRAFDRLLVATTLLFALAHFFREDIARELAGIAGTEIAARLFQVSCIPWIYLFLLGVLAQRHAQFLIAWCQRLFWPIILAYAAMAAALLMLGAPLGNAFPTLAAPLMGLAVLAVGYTRPTVSARIVGHTDCSYGVYVYHMPVINCLIELGMRGNPAAVLLALAATAVLGLASWRWIERPFLRRKKIALRPA
jgi:peptidoglycan/LPS O-acetylase OafA/YrhL